MGGFVLAQTITVTTPQFAMSSVGALVAVTAVVAVLLPGGRRRDRAGPTPSGK